MQTPSTDKLRGGLQIVGSLWFAAVVLVLLLVAMACATVYESMHGTEQAMLTFYKSSWFESLLFLLAVNVLAATIVRYPFSNRRIGFVMTHASILVILGGALVTKYFGIDGQVSILEGETAKEFHVPAETLTLTNPSNSTISVVNLNSEVFGGLTVVEDPKDAIVALGEVKVRVERYLPDSVPSERMVNDNPQPRAAVELSVSASGHDDTTWVVEGEHSQFGTVEVGLRTVRDGEELRQLLEPSSDKPATSVGTVKIEFAGTTFERQVEACMDKAVPIGDTGYAVHVLRYFNHATVGPNNEITNASDRLVNPAIQAEIIGPKGTEKRTAFARFPDFGSMHKETATPELNLVFVASDAQTPTRSSTPIEVLVGPTDQLRLRFAAADGTTTTREARVGEAVDTPWPGRKITIASRLDHARPEQSVTPADPIRETRMPAVLVAIESAGERSETWLQKSQPRRVTVHGLPYEVAYGEKSVPFGFSFELTKFTVGYYPGGNRPRSFESQITITDPADGRTQGRVISMNHPTSYNGFTLYQSSYQLTGKRAVSVLSVAKDPGQVVVFAGYFGLLAGMIVVLGVRVYDRRRLPADDEPGHRAARGDGRQTISLLSPGERCRQAPPGGSEPPSHTGQSGGVKAMSRIVLIVAAMLPALVSAQEAKLPANLDVTVIRGLCLQHDGRWPPLDTVARDLVVSVTGNASYRGFDPVLWLLAWTFDPDTWMKEPLITIRNAELRRELQLSPTQTVFSYSELLNHRPLRSLIDALGHVERGRKMNPLESKVSDISDKLSQLQTVFRDQAIKPIPDSGSALGAWKPIGPGAPADLNAAWDALRDAFRRGDSPAFAAASDRLLKAASALPALYRPDAQALATELDYNRIRPFTAAWKVMLVGALLAAAAILIRRRWFDGLAVVGMLAGFGLLTYGLSLRWHIAGRIPASNMFESLLFLSWGMGAFAILSVFLFRDRLVPLTASGMGALALILADCLPLDHFIRPIAPVLLDTIWMSIHVPIIMVSYSVLALAVLVAHAQLIVMAFAPRRAHWSTTIDRLHYWYVHVGTILLTAGIATGSMWAASSWGRYWGWDPKEVWSLVALLGYLTILHVRPGPEPLPRWAYAMGMLLTVALLAIIVPKLSPMTGGKGLAIAAMIFGMAVLILAHGPFAAAAKSIMCFWLIIMTYVGVNYVLGIGLHSYGFGTGAVVHYMFLTGGIDLGFVALLSIVYWIRRGPSTVAAAGLRSAVPA